MYTCIYIHMYTYKQTHTGKASVLLSRQSKHYVDLDRAWQTDGFT